METAERLKEAGLRPWLDEWELRPGVPWLPVLQRQIERIPACAVFWGGGVGPWQDLEIQAFLQQLVSRQCPVIPVMLPDRPDASTLPPLLAVNTFVDFRVSHPDPLDRLVWGIKGEKPEVGGASSAGDERHERLLRRLDDAHRRKEEIISAGGNRSSVQEEILDLRRRLREGGRLGPGDFLSDGRFRLLAVIGKGGYAEVWKAYDRKRQKLVAIKVLHGQHRDGSTSHRRFFRGGRKMSELSHPGIVRVVEPPRSEGGYRYLVMEYVGGGNLRQAVGEGSRTTAERLRLILAVGAALAHAHDAGIVHRDVKPENILLDDRDRPKLTDFDLVLDPDTTGGTRTGSMLGTVLYMVPEARYRAKDVGPKADIYSLAMTATFVLHGEELPPTVLSRPA